MKQTGFLYELRPTDYILGSTSPLKGEDINVSGDWIASKPADEKQYEEFKFDTMSCATFSGTSNLETLFNFFKENNIFSDEQIAWATDEGYIVDDKFNFSDCFSAIVNGTMPNGNYFQNVWDSFRHDGLLPEADLPFGGNSQAEYLDKTKVTQAMRDKAKKFLDVMIAKDANGKYLLNYEWVPVTTGVELHAALRQAPIQVAVTKENPSHAIVLLRMDTEFESYPPYVRQRNRTIAYALKPIVKIKKEETVQILKVPFRPKNFKIGELVPKYVIEKVGDDKVWELLDERMTRNLQFFRDVFGTTTVNTAIHQYRCFDPVYFRKDGLSQHNHGRGVDCIFKHYTAEQVRDWLRVSENAAKLPYPDIWVELETAHFHFDVRYSDKSGVYFFNP